MFWGDETIPYPDYTYGYMTTHTSKFRELWTQKSKFYCKLKNKFPKRLGFLKNRKAFV